MMKKPARKRSRRPSARRHAAPPARSMAAQTTSARAIWDCVFLIAVAVSILFHAMFLYMSQTMKMASIAEVEQGVETLFRVKFRDLQSLEFVSRPTSEQLKQERDRVMQEEIASIDNLTNRSAANTLDSNLPSISDSAAASSRPGDRDDDFYVDDSPARSLITSEVGDGAVTSFENASGTGIIEDEVETNRIALMGRGGGSTRRIAEDLPEPSISDEPAASRAITMALLTDMKLPEPNLEMEEPPIDLPDDTELLPSPEILPEAPISASLESEEKALGAIEEKFIQLDDLVQVDLFTYHHVGGDGYFMIKIRPRASDERLKILPKDVIFVLDASASMGRLTIGVAKDEIKKCIDRLRLDDRFNVVGFNQRVRRFVSDFSPATDEAVKKAGAFIEPLRATGMTDIYASLEPLVQLGTERARPLIVMLFSDGRPNVGVVNSRKIINNLTRFQGPSTSIYCVGTGDEVNEYLLDMLAFRNRGQVWFGKERDTLPQLIPAVFNYLADPVLLRIQANVSRVDEAEIYPKRLPDLNMNGELRLWGRLRGETSIPLRLVGEAWDEQKEIVFELPVPEIDNATYEIAREWARSKIYHIAGLMVTEGEKPEYLDQINFLSRTYRIDTPYSENLAN